MPISNFSSFKPVDRFLEALLTPRRLRELYRMHMLLAFWGLCALIPFSMLLYGQLYDSILGYWSFIFPLNLTATVTIFAIRKLRPLFPAAMKWIFYPMPTLCLLTPCVIVALTWI